MLVEINDVINVQNRCMTTYGLKTFCVFYFTFTVTPHVLKYR